MEICGIYIEDYGRVGIFFFDIKLGVGDNNKFGLSLSYDRECILVRLYCGIEGDLVSEFVIIVNCSREG